MKTTTDKLLASVAALLSALLIVGIIVAVNTTPTHQETYEERGVRRYHEAFQDEAIQALAHGEPRSDKEIHNYFAAKN